MGSEIFNWCFIGTGTLAKQVAEEITASGRHRLAAVYSHRYEKAEPSFVMHKEGKADQQAERG